MGLNWSLKEIYESFQCEEFKNDMKKVDKLIYDYNTFVNDAVLNHEEEESNLKIFIQKSEELMLLVGRLDSFASLTVSVDSTHKEGRKYSDIISTKWSSLTEPNTKMYKWIAEIRNIEELIKNSTELSKYEFYIGEIIEQSKYILSDREETIIAKMRNTG